MSGICGMFGAYAEDLRAERELSSMMRHLEHRGPHGMASKLDRGRQMALGLRLLCPQGEAQGDQAPVVLTAADGQVQMVWDGQVFNRADVAAYLASKGHFVKTAHSGELLLYLYLEDGPDGFRRVDGQFALAIWDGRRDRLVLARDFLGVRPLYYKVTSQGVIFASEIKALLQHSQVTPEADVVGVSHYLTFLSTPGPRTLFAGVNRLAAGTTATFTRGGAVDHYTFWDLLRSPIAEQDDERFYVDRVRELVEQSVRRRQVEGPIGALVSGGNDSSANASLLHRFGAGPLHTFTVGLKDVEGQAAYNDMLYARKVAELIGSKHHESLITVDEFLASLVPVTEALDDLVSEPSSIFLYHALKMAKDQGLKVVLTGEANDEISCGHGEMIKIRNRYYERWQKYMRLPRVVRAFAAQVGPRIWPGRRDILERAAAGSEYFWNFETAWMETDKPEILTASAWERCRYESPEGVVNRIASKVRATDHGRRDYLNYMIYAMMQDPYFGNLMLGKLDLLSSHLGIESRCPYTAPEYAHFVYNIPAKFKFKGNLVKSFFKKAITGILPDDIIYRPKQGFRTPVVELFQGRLGAYAQPILLDGGLTSAGVLRRDQLQHLLTLHREGRGDYSNKLWTAMALNLWHDRFVRGHVKRADPPVPLRRNPDQTSNQSGNQTGARVASE